MTDKFVVSLHTADPSKSFFDDVNEWHRQMGLPTAETDRIPGVIGFTEFRYRLNFLFEELRELIEAQERRDLPGVADALVDLVWVACGTACYYGVPFNELWAEVRRANSTKRPWREGDPVKPRNYTAGEIVKPDGWRPPDIRGVLERSRRRSVPEPESDGCMCYVGTGMCPIHGVE